MMGKTITTPWDDHWRQPEFLNFVRWAVGRPELRKRYRDATGDDFELELDQEKMRAQVERGEALEYMQRFTDWIAENVFGTPDEPLVEATH